MTSYTGYSGYYNEVTFWSKVKKLASGAGREVLRRALQLYYTAMASSTPPKVRALIWGALGYFILPFDAVPDFLPMIGLTDDIAAMTAVIGMVAMHMTPEIKAQAEKKLEEIFG
jgi:uncharacterized membrane protein YkvA (DUF1232 family)